MLNKLTKKQEAKMAGYVTKGLEIGLSTAPINKDEANKAIDLLYQCGDLTPPETRIFVRSPLEAIETVLQHTKKYSRNDFLYQFQYGNQDISWIQFYKFFQQECNIKNLEKIEGLYQMALNCGWYLAFDTTIVVCERPIAIHRNAAFQLHKDGAACLSFSDGYSLYYLNGIAIPKEMVLADAKDISVQDVMKEQNVDIRRELLKKVGLERFISDTKATELDREEMKMNGKTCLYQLLSVNLGEGITATVLKMDNPSINAMHVEGVEDTCKTVKEALAWRNGFEKYVAPISLT